MLIVVSRSGERWVTEHFSSKAGYENLLDEAWQ